LIPCKLLRSRPRFGIHACQGTSQSVVPVIDRRLKITEITDHMITPDKSSPVF
jgi:hypothetical protein